MSAIWTSLLEAIFGLLFNKARDSAAEKLKYGDVTDKRIRELIQREIDDIKSKLDGMSRTDLLTAMDEFELGVRYLYQALGIDSEGMRLATSTMETPLDPTQDQFFTAAIEKGIRNLELTEVDNKASRSLRKGAKKFERARDKASDASNNETLDTLQRINAIRYRVLASMLESVTESLEGTKELSSLHALQTAKPECAQSLQKLHSLPDVEKNFEVALRSDLLNIRGRFGRDKRREIICAVCQINRLIYDTLKYNFDNYDCATIKIGGKSINPLCNRKVAKFLEKNGMQRWCIEWSFGHNGEEGHRLKKPSRIATNARGEFLVVDSDDKTVKVFDSRGEFIYKINPKVDDTVRIVDVADVATDVNNDTYILVWLEGRGDYRHEVQVFTKTKMWNKFPVHGDERSCLTVGHDRAVFVERRHVIDLYHGRRVRSGFGGGTVLSVTDIAAGSDDEIFVLEDRLIKNHDIVRVFTKDGHQQKEFRVDSKEDVYVRLCRLACYQSDEEIVLAGVERKTRRLKVAMYSKDGEFNRSVTLNERIFNDQERYIHKIFGIAVTNDGSVAISFNDQEDQSKVIVRSIKPC